MKRTKGQAAAARKSQDKRHFLSGAIVISRRVQGDLGHRFRGKVCKLKFFDRTMPVDRQTDRVAGTRRLAKGRAEHSRTPEISDQSLGDFERAAIGSDVL